MKKIIISFIVIPLFLMAGCMSQSPQNNQKSSFYWIPEESGFLNYEIIGKKIIFSYSICFVNDSNEEQTVSLSAKFKPKELKGWVKETGFFIGNDEKGNLLNEKIPARSKEKLTFFFEGEYLGGKVNTNLSFPDEIILMN